MARRIHLDIETYRTRNSAVINRLTNEALTAEFTNQTPKAKKEAWHTPEARENRVYNALSKTSANPLYAEILVISFKTEHESFTLDAMEQSEHDCLLQFSEIVNEISNEGTIWTAFNGKNFDFMILLNRFARYRIRPPEHFPIYTGYWKGRLFDTSERIPSRDPFISFAKVCEVYGIDCKTVQWQNEPMTGSRVGLAYELGEYQLIRDYCDDDVIHEEQLYLAMTHNDTWGTFDNGNNDLAVLSEIANDDDLSSAHKWAAAYPILKSARIIQS